MAARIPAKLVALLTLLMAGSAAIGQDQPLVEYNFDGNLLESGPDTFQVFKNNHNKAALSHELAHSGDASIHLTDPPDDQDFVEFQGYFASQNSGVLSLEFSFLLADADSVFNMALTGEEKYRLHKHGINFWLFYDGEWLRSYSNSIPVKLLQPEPFRWYTVQARLDFRNASYDLHIVDEYQQTAYAGQALIFAPGRHPQHSVTEFSFVGDIQDIHPSDFFIDSFQLSTSNETTPTRLVAPGRKKLFVDYWNEYQARVQGHLQCLPAIDLDDLGIDDEDLASIFSRGEMDKLLELTAGKTFPPTNDTKKLHPKLQALAHWRQSCILLENTATSGSASQSIDRALEIAPHAYIYQLSDIIIKSAGLSPAELLLRMSALRNGDIRTEIALAMMASRYRNTTLPAGQFYPPDLSAEPGSELGELDPSIRSTLVVNNTELAVQRLQHFMPETWEAFHAWHVAMEFQFLGLLGRGDYLEAQALAERVTGTLQTLELPAYLWQERSADIALLLHQPQHAIEYYEAIRSITSLRRVDLKLSDAYYMLGDYDSEKDLRESIYLNFDRE